MTTTSPECSVRHVSPILSVTDMETALAFYRDMLWFTVARRDPNYSIIVKDHGSIHLRLAEKGKSVEAREIYIEVAGIDALWEHARQYQNRYKTRELFTQDYGMREFHIIAPDNCLVFVGQVV